MNVDFISKQKITTDILHLLNNPDMTCYASSLMQLNYMLLYCTITALDGKCQHLSTSIITGRLMVLSCMSSPQEKESVFLLDDKRISEINMVSGRTKKRTPKLHPLLNNVLTMASSHCGTFYKIQTFLLHVEVCQGYTSTFTGTWLCGVLVAGELFLWNKDRDLLKTVGAAPEVVDIIASSQGLFAVAVY